MLETLVSGLLAGMRCMGHAKMGPDPTLDQKGGERQISSGPSSIVERQAETNLDAHYYIFDLRSQQKL